MPNLAEISKIPFFKNEWKQSVMADDGPKQKSHTHFQAWWT